MAYVDDVLTNIGVTVKVGNTTIQGAYQYGDLGADANELDATPLSSTHAIKKPGLIDEPAWELDYYFNEADFDAIAAVKSAGTSVALEISFPDGVKFTNTGECASNYLTGDSTGNVAKAKATFTLGNTNGWVKVPASGNG